jgi:hypothetical protein
MDAIAAKDFCLSNDMWLATIKSEGDLVDARRSIAEGRLEYGDLMLDVQTWIGLERGSTIPGSETCVNTDGDTDGDRDGYFCDFYES